MRIRPSGAWLSALLFGLTLALACPARAHSTPARRASLELDVSAVAFSRAGSYLAFSSLPASADRPAGLFLRSAHGEPAHQSLLVVEPLVGGKPVPYHVRASASVLRLEVAQGGFVELAFESAEVVRLRARGAGLRLRAWHLPLSSVAFRGPGDRWVINDGANGVQLMLTPLRGRLAVDAPWDGVRSSHIVADFDPGADGELEGAIEEFLSTWQPRAYPQPFDEVVSGAERELAAFAERLPKVESRYDAAAALAAYVLWSNRVRPLGNFKRPTTLMTKKSWIGVWTWDEAFDAMVLADGDPASAWDQFLSTFDAQDGRGGLPDRSSDRATTWGHAKPPVQGWALGWLMKRSPFFRRREVLQSIYESLARWTDWWFHYRDDDGDGLVEYQHGNDSGWDNATPFLAGVPLESPDVSALLAIQMDVLADVAAKLGRREESRGWRRRADGLVDRLIGTLWRGDRFVAMPLRGGDPAGLPGDSLLLYLPLVLGPRLPEEVRTKLIEGLTRPGRFLTDHGLATESRQSPYFAPDGFFRGAVWAPATLLFDDALRASGQTALADDLARKFCDIASRSQMPQSFDAVSGRGLRESGSAWTASAFLVLAHTLNR